MDAAADALWLALRAEIAWAEHMTEFDIRNYMRLAADPVALARWHERRRVWLVEMFREDPRVTTAD